MRLPLPIELLHVPSGIDVEAEVIELTEALIRSALGAAWWDDPAIDPSLADAEIDRDWDWASMQIERDDRAIASRKLAVTTGDGRVQGAMLISTEPVACQHKSHRGRPALFVELLFAAPATRHWIRFDRSEQFRGVGLHLLRTAAALSLEAGFDGRLKLDSSPGFVDWYKRRGLLTVSRNRIMHEGVIFKPMELTADRVPILLPERKKEA